MTTTYLSRNKGGNERIHGNVPIDYPDVVVHVGMSQLLEDDIGVCIYRRVELDEALRYKASDLLNLSWLWKDQTEPSACERERNGRVTLGC